MRKYFLISMLLLPIMLFGQTALTDAGTFDDDDKSKLAFSFSGTVRTTGSLNTNTFELPPDYRNFTETWAKFTGADSIKLSIKLQGYMLTKWGTPGWVDLLTIYSSDTDSVQQVERDTLLVTSADTYRLNIAGVTGNSHTPATTFEGKIYFIKKE